MKKTLIAILSVLTLASFNANSATPKDEPTIVTGLFKEHSKGVVVTAQYESLINSLEQLNIQLEGVWDFYETMNKAYGAVGVPDDVLDKEFERVTGLKRNMDRADLITHLWATDPQLLKIASTVLASSGRETFIAKSVAGYDVLSREEIINKVNIQLISIGLFGDQKEKNSIINLSNINQPDLDIYKIRLFGLLLTDYINETILIQDVKDI